MTLHILNRPFTGLADLVSEGDSLLLIENGVYLHGDDLPKLKTFVLQADLEARGLGIQNNHISVDYAGFVELCTQHAKVVSW